MTSSSERSTASSRVWYARRDQVSRTVSAIAFRRVHATEADVPCQSFVTRRNQRGAAVRDSVAEREPISPGASWGKGVAVVWRRLGRLSLPFFWQGARNTLACANGFTRCDRQPRQWDEVPSCGDKALDLPTRRGHAAPLHADLPRCHSRSRMISATICSTRRSRSADRCPMLRAQGGEPRMLARQDKVQRMQSPRAYWDRISSETSAAVAGSRVR